MAKPVPTYGRKTNKPKHTGDSEMLEMVTPTSLQHFNLLYTAEVSFQIKLLCPKRLGANFALHQIII
jgi:hypothetical protein